jgi:hypothetical protein
MVFDQFWSLLHPYFDSSGIVHMTTLSSAKTMRYIPAVILLALLVLFVLFAICYSFVFHTGLSILVTHIAIGTTLAIFGLIGRSARFQDPIYDLVANRIPEALRTNPIDKARFKVSLALDTVSVATGGIANVGYVIFGIKTMDPSDHGKISLSTLGRISRSSTSLIILSSYLTLLLLVLLYGIIDINPERSFYIKITILLIFFSLITKHVRLIIIGASIPTILRINSKQSHMMFILLTIADFSSFVLTTNLITNWNNLSALSSLNSLIVVGKQLSSKHLGELVTSVETRTLPSFNTVLFSFVCCIVGYNLLRSLLNRGDFVRKDDDLITQAANSVFTRDYTSAIELLDQCNNRSINYYYVKSSALIGALSFEEAWDNELRTLESLFKKKDLNDNIIAIELSTRIIKGKMSLDVKKQFLNYIESRNISDAVLAHITMLLFFGVQQEEDARFIPDNIAAKFWITSLFTTLLTDDDVDSCQLKLSGYIPQGRSESAIIFRIYLIILLVRSDGLDTFPELATRYARFCEELEDINAPYEQTMVELSTLEAFYLTAVGRFESYKQPFRNVMKKTLKRNCLKKFPVMRSFFELEFQK